jgi:hypothetical protein
VTRVLRFFALFTALFVVSVRCVSGLPLAALCVAGALGSAEAHPCSDEPREQDALAPVAVDDSDDDADPDPVVASTAPRIRLLSDGEPCAAECAAMEAEPSLPSHARSLERPPRV